MICRHCGTEISTKNREKAGSIVCPKCGARYQHKSNAQTVSKKRASATRCASCGEVLKEGAEFCHVCGTPRNQHKRYYNVSVSGQEKQKKPKRKKSVLFVLLIIALITALLFAGEKFINATKRANRSELQTATSRDGKKIVLYPTDPDHVVEDPATTTSFVDNELILSLDNNVSIEELSIMLQQFGGAIAGVNDYLHTYQILFDSTYSHNELKELAAELNRRISSAKAMPNYILQLGLTDYNPNDSEWITEWGNPGGKSWGPEAIRAPKMWEICRSMKRNPINIGVLDNQFYTDHEDLDFTETWNNNYNLWGEGIQFLKANHGTHVAGTAAATANNGKGVAGLALSENSSNLIHLFGASMNGLNNEIREDVYGMSVDAYEAGLVYLIAMKECKVINLSYGGGLSSPVSADEINIVSHIEDTLLSLIHEGYDFLIVKSSGNDRTDYANYDLFTLFREKEVLDRIITVGAAEQDKNGNIYIAEYSNFGDSVDLIAPGTDIWSTVGNGVLWWVNSGYAKNSGTSMASPHVAGTASAIWCVYPNLTGPQMKQILCESAAGKYYYKEGLQYSYPMLDAYRAIQLADEFVSQHTLSEQEPEQDNELPQEQNIEKEKIADNEAYIKAAESYLDLLYEKIDAINSYTWERGYSGNGYPSGDEIARPVALCDIYGDDVPELLFLYCDTPYTIRLQIVSVVQDQPQILYDKEWGGLVGGGLYYYLFQLKDNKQLYCYTRHSGETKSKNYSVFEETADHELATESILSHVTRHGNSQATYQELYDEYQQGTNIISREDFLNSEEIIQYNIENLLMFSTGCEGFPEIFAKQNGCSALTCDEAISLLSRFLAAAEIK